MASYLLTTLCKAIHISILTIIISTIFLINTSQADDGPIFGNDITLEEIEYSDEEIQQLHKQLISDKEQLREIYHQNNNSLKADTDIDYFDDLFNDIFDRKIDPDLASSLIGSLYFFQVKPFDHSSKTKIEMASYLMTAQANKTNDVHDQYFIGWMLTLNNNLSIKNIKRSYYWLTRAANNGSNEAAYILGIKYFGACNDYPNNTRLKHLTVSNLKQAAEGGLAESAYILGRYYNSHGSNDIEATKWMKVAAEAGIGAAAGQLGLKYAFGRGVPTDYKKAFLWTKKGVDAGDPSSMAILGMLYEQGWGTKINTKKALSYYAKSCELGDERACEDHNRLYKMLNYKTVEEQGEFWLSK